MYRIPKHHAFLEDCVTDEQCRGVDHRTLSPAEEAKTIDKIGDCGECHRRWEAYQSKKRDAELKELAAKRATET